MTSNRRKSRCTALPGAVLGRRLVLLGALLAAGVPAVRGAATGPSTWVQSGYDDFGAGKLVSVALDDEGEISLAPELNKVGDTGEALVWAVDEAQDGSVFAAAGTEGRVLRFAPGTDVAPETFFDAEGTVHAMTLGPDGNLYVAASPGGAVWRLPLSGDIVDAAPLFTTGAQYVWALVVADDGTVYAGTGDAGVIWRISADGEGEELYDTDEAHVTALALDDDGNLLAGTADSGHLYRIAPDGDVFVLFDAPMKQITGIVPTATGVYFAALERDAGSVGGDGASGGNGNDDAPLKGAVYLLHDDGFIERLWGSGERSSYALAMVADGVVVGTGDEGRLLRVERGPAAAVLGDVEAAQVSALRDRGADTIVGTSNPGLVYRLRTAYRENGEYLSQVKDTTTVSRWGRLRWRGTVPAGGAIRLYTRSGNTAEPDATWSDWSDGYGDPAGTPIASPAARFVQWKAELRRGANGASPVLQWVELVYVQRNLRPEINEFTVHPAGVIYRQNTSFEDSLPIGRLPSSVREALDEQQGRSGGSGAGSASSFLGQAYYLPGSQTFSWDASDANGDRLSYSLWYRGEAEDTWKPIVEEQSDNQYLWDTTTVPDGLYRARIVATDAPSNPAGEELEGVRASQPLVIDNTAPRIDNLSATETGGAVMRVTGEAIDATSLIRAMEYAVDGGGWHAVMPADGLPDASSEGIGFDTIRLEPGEHTIVVRVTDTALNSGTAKVVVNVQ
ncbi:MAG: hypothetical protein PVJ49_07540 [Acidobacteriota bacterium]|jgi:hypothetical protein